MRAVTDSSHHRDRARPFVQHRGKTIDLIARVHGNVPTGHRRDVRRALKRDDLVRGNTDVDRRIFACCTAALAHAHASLDDEDLVVFE